MAKDEFENKKTLGCCCDGQIECKGDGAIFKVAIAPLDFKLGDDESKLKWMDVNEESKNKNKGFIVQLESTKSMLKKGTHPNQKFYEDMGLWDKKD